MTWEEKQTLFARQKERELSRFMAAFEIRNWHSQRWSTSVRGQKDDGKTVEIIFDLDTFAISRVSVGEYDIEDHRFIELAQVWISTYDGNIWRTENSRDSSYNTELQFGLHCLGWKQDLSFHEQMEVAFRMPEEFKPENWKRETATQ